MSGVAVGAPDISVDALFPKCIYVIVGQKYTPLLLHGINIDPFKIGVIVGKSTVGQRRNVIFEIAGFLNVLKFVRNSVQVSQYLAQQSSANFILNFSNGHLNCFRLLAHGFFSCEDHQQTGGKNELGSFHFIFCINIRFFCSKALYKGIGRQRLRDKVN